MSRPHALSLASNRLCGKQSTAFDRSVNNTPTCLFSSSVDSQFSMHLIRSAWQLCPFRRAFKRSLRIDSKWHNSWSFSVDSYHFDIVQSIWGQNGLNPPQIATKMKLALCCREFCEPFFEDYQNQSSGTFPNCAISVWTLRENIAKIGFGTFYQYGQMHEYLNQYGLYLLLNY